MKKTLLSVLLTVALLCTAIIPAYAAESEPTAEQLADGTTVIYYDDGSSLTISPIYGVQEKSMARAGEQTVSGGRDVTFADPNGTLEWKYTLSATFSYVSGVSSTCTSASYTKTIYDNDWSFSNGSATKSGNTAYGKGHFTKKVLFITIKNYDIDISISCDKYGKLS